MTQAEFNRGVQAEINLLCRKVSLEALADVRKLLEGEMREYSAEIKSLIERRFEKWQALQKVERELKIFGERNEP